MVRLWLEVDLADMPRAMYTEGSEIYIAARDRLASLIQGELA